ncbi:hypothetical protein CU098_003954 [Rhizopus stolonifer]|uniref:Peripheral subunit-binding (PSBD) domain-containing protein n=1 Tax=Rhizopus stolonifer TaxID=4846 RepID=A0A367IZI4_RHIST|nr:hypothetical protein CU098_003954 [Rhizopus stolonifer]
MAKVGAPLLDIEVEPSAEEVDSVVPENKSLNEPLKGTLDMSFWQAPSVRRLLDQYGLSITQINGSGKSGRVLKHDVLNYIKENLLTKKAVPVVDAQEKVKPVIEEPIIDNEYRTVPLTPIQKIMFKKMTHSLSIPHLGYKDEYELNSTLEYRAALNKHIINQPDTYSFKKISYLPIFIKSLSLCLNHYPIMNAMHQDTIVQYRDYHHIGIAMDTPQGLVVPNIKHVEKKTVFEVASEIHRLTQQAKKGTLSPLDLKGGTITISNIGSIGGTYANPVIVSPEMAIVAIGAAKKLPRFDRNTHQIEPKYIMPISWSADHRIIDGATIAQFSNMWKSFIENPALLSSQLQ